MVRFARWIYLGITFLVVVGLASCREADTAVSTAAPISTPIPTITYPPQPTLQNLVTPLPTATAPTTQTAQPGNTPTPKPLSPEIFPIPEAQINALAPTLYENFLFVPAGNRLAVLDVSDPTHITEVGHRYLDGGIIKLLVDGQYAYALRQIRIYETSALEILDVRDPTHLRSLHSYTPTTYRIADFAVSGHYAYFLEGNGWSRHWLNWLDISNPAQPTHEGAAAQIFGAPRFFTASDNMLYFAHSQADRYQIRYDAFLEIFNTAVSHNLLPPVARYDLTTLNEPNGWTWVSRYVAGQFANKVYLISLVPEGGFLLDAEQTSYDLHVLDMTDQAAPVDTILFHNVSKNMLMLTPTIGYEQAADALHFFDLSTPPEPIVAGTFPLSAYAQLRVLGTKESLVYVLLQENDVHSYAHYELIVLDISDLTNPHMVGDFVFDSP